jgi:hypothetical protein
MSGDADFLATCIAAFAHNNISSAVHDAALHILSHQYVDMNGTLLGCKIDRVWDSVSRAK